MTASPAPAPGTRSADRAEPAEAGRPADHLSWCADPYARALRTGRGPLFLRRADGRLLPLDVERWCAGADEADRTVLRRCAGAVLDIGCGPGRMVAALTAPGRTVLGVDPAPAAVARTRDLGGAALCRSVFDPLPGEGRWDSALLLDGNIGMGGDPAALLARVGRLLAPDGVLLAEAAPAEVEERMEVRLDDGRGDPDPDRHGPFFPWSRLGRTALRARAEAEGWTVAEEWDARGRFFLALRPGRGARTVRGAVEAERRTRGRGRGGGRGHGVTSR